MAWFDRNPGGKVEAEKALQNSKPAPQAVVTPVEALPKPAQPEPPGAAAPSMAGLAGYLYKGSRVSGQLSFQGPARIDGAVDGEIHCQATLTIGDGAEIRAKITGQTVVIHGKVEGNVTAKEKVELLAPARLIGNIKAPRLLIAEGVMFDGDCSMGAVKQAGGAANAQIAGDNTVVAAPPVKLQADSKK